MVDVLNPSFTTGTQWFERTLDDSANKRVAMAEGFLATDAILNIMLNVTDGIVVYPKVVRSRLMASAARKPSAMATRLLALSSRVRSNHWVPVVKLGFSTSTIR